MSEKEHKEIFWGARNVLYLDLSESHTNVYMYKKKNQVVYFTLCKLFLNLKKKKCVSIYIWKFNSTQEKL